jgi:hypothetical protein
MSKNVHFIAMIAKVASRNPDGSRMAPGDGPSPERKADTPMDWVTV